MRIVTRRSIVFVLLFGLAPAPARAQDQQEGPVAPVPFLTPPQAIAKMTITEGFEVTAFAAEPDVVQPFAFTFDDRGRIWVAENLNYETRGSDTFAAGPKGRIAILEDTDGDGRFDTRKVFAEKIFFPSGLEIGYGGVFVGSPPNLLFIPDADGDDVPDGEPRILLDGWGRDDRHETLNSFLWGPDGWLYGCHGVFTHSRVGKPGTPDGDRTPINAGVWRYHPTQQAFEVFAWGTSNPWGLDFDDHGQAFITACVIPHLWHMIQGGRYHRQGGLHFDPHVYEDIKTITDHPHLSAHGGARFYLADSFPARYRGRLLMCNIHQHDILTDVLERRGSGFVGHHGDDFLKSNDPQWLGFNLEVGPEGAVYVIDWHDADICGRKVFHEETGRIWRVAYQGTKAAIGLDLAKRSDQELIGLQFHANDWYVRHARRLLAERAARGELSSGTHPALRGLVEKHPETPRRLRSLWALHATGGLGDEFATRLLDDPDEYVRAWAIQLLCEDRDPPAAAKERFATMAREDASAIVRLYLASACQRLAIADRWDILAALAAREEDQDDHNVPLLIWYALEPAVASDTKRALEVARSAKLSKIRQFIPRRLAAAAATKRAAEPLAPPATPAPSVPNDGLALWLRADWAVVAKSTSDAGTGAGAKPGAAGDAGSREAIAALNDRSTHHRDAKAASADTQPQRVAALGGRNALSFDGDDDRLVVPHADLLSFRATDDYTIAAWVFVEKTPQDGWRAIVAKSRDRGSWYGLWIDPQRRWVFGADEGNLAGTPAEPGWRHVAGVQRGAGERLLFVDGALVARGTAIDANGAGDLAIGAANGVDEAFRGGLSEVRVYRRALTGAEIAHLATQP